MKKLYIIGSLRNPAITGIAAAIREACKIEVFDDWHCAGPEADDFWQHYERTKGNRYAQALAGYAATHVFEFDKFHLDSADGVLLVLPAGRSGHLELGYMAGQGKWTGILLETAEPDRWDVMYRFATHVFPSLEAATKEINNLNVNIERGN